MEAMLPQREPGLGKRSPPRPQGTRCQGELWHAVSGGAREGVPTQAGAPHYKANQPLEVRKRMMMMRAHCWAWGQISPSGLGCKMGTEPMGRKKNTE